MMSNPATYTVDESAGTITIVGSGHFWVWQKQTIKMKRSSNDDTLIYIFTQKGIVSYNWVNWL